jgi:hypothetical protein
VLSASHVLLIAGLAVLSAMDQRVPAVVAACTVASEVTSALQGVSRAFTGSLPCSAAARDWNPSDARAAEDAAWAAEAAAEAVADAAEPEGVRESTSASQPQTVISRDERRLPHAGD